eukprot:scaffold135147_cov65-Phaeocystis_antarctica.AAC.3
MGEKTNVSSSSHGKAASSICFGRPRRNQRLSRAKMALAYGYARKPSKMAAARTMGENMVKARWSS